MKKHFSIKHISVFIGSMAALFFFAAAADVFALSYSPSTIYPGTPYTLSESVSNSSGSAVSVTKDCFWWKNDVYGGPWGHEVINVPNGGTTATCSSTGDTAGSAMRFQMNIWRPDYNGTPSISTASFTVKERPVASVDITGPSSAIAYDTSAFLSISSTNAISCSVSPSGGGSWYIVDAQATRGTWKTAGLTSNTTFTVTCNPDNGATNSPSDSVTVSVKATPTITWSNPSAITYGTALGATQLNATANVTGTFSYDPASGTVLGANETDSQGLSVSFTPTDTTNYNNASKTVYIFVNKASQTISFAALGNKTMGDAPFTVSATGGASGNSVTFSAPATSPANQCSVSGSTVTINGVGTCTIRASQAGNTNYNAATSIDRSFTVSQPAQTLTRAISPSDSGSILCQVGTGTAGACASSYAYGTVVNLSAPPAANYVFSNWSGDCTGATCSLTMNGAKSVTANFASSFNYTINQPNIVPTLTQGQYSDVFIATTLVSGSTQGVTLAATGLGGGTLPSGITYTVDPAGSLNAGVTRVFRFTAASNAAIGTHTIQINGSPLGKTIQFNLTIAAPTVTPALTAKDANDAVTNEVQAGGTLSFTTAVSGTAAGPVSYTERSCGGGNISFENDGSFKCAFPTASATPKRVSIKVTKQGVSAVAEKYITVTAIPSRLTIQSTVDGELVSHLFVEFDSGTFVGKTVQSPITMDSTSDINSWVSVGRTFGGGTFISWSGCDEVGAPGGRGCHVTVSNGVTKNISANYGTITYRPDVSISSVRMEGDRYKGTSTFVAGSNEFGSNHAGDENFFYIVTVKNVGRLPAEGVSVSFEKSSDNAHFTSFGGATISRLGPRGETDAQGKPTDTKSVYVKDVFPPEPVYLRSVVDQPSDGSPTGSILESDENNNASPSSGGTLVRFDTPPPPPASPCNAAFTNTNLTDSEENVRTKVSATVTGCDPNRWLDLAVSGSAGTNTTAETVLDLALGFWRAFGNSGKDRVIYGGQTFTDSFEAKAILANQASSVTSQDGWGLQFGPISFQTSNGLFSYGPVFKTGKYHQYINYGTQSTKRGLYRYTIADTIAGRFLCFVDSKTTYNAACDISSIHYDPQNCDGVAFPSAIDSPYIWPPRTLNGLNNPPLRATATLNMCFRRHGVTGDYYETSCGSASPGYADIRCPGGTVPLQASTGGTGFTDIPLVVRRLTLDVKSTLDGSSRPNVIIKQVGGSAKALGGTDTNYGATATSIQPLEGGDFGGTTDYRRTTERNFIVTLEAPATHPNGGIFKPSQGWTGCDLISDATPETSENDERLCKVSVTYTPTGGQTKTVIANYSSTLAAPTVSTNTPSCDAGQGKIQVWWDAVPGATSYKLYRRSIVPTSYFTQVDADSGLSGTQAFTTAPTQITSGAGANPFFDSALNAGASYEYYIVARGSGSISSPASAVKQDDASTRCPDLVVARLNIQNLDGTPAPSPIVSPVVSGGAPPSFRFSAVIKNVGDGTGISFDNQFLVNGTQYGLEKRITGGLAQDATQTVTSDNWTAPIVTTNTTRTVEVCADRPPPEPGTILEAPPTGVPATGSNPAETNNCASADTTIARTLTIVPPISVELEAAKAGTQTYSRDYVIVDYSDLANLRWKVTGNPTSCAASANTDWTGSKPNESYVVTNNPFSLTGLLNKILFTYKIECTR